MPPATHNGADRRLQPRIWRKFWLNAPRGVTATTKAFRPICKPAYARRTAAHYRRTPLGRDRHQQARQHHEHQDEPDRHGVRVEPVGHPGGVVPRPVHRDEHECGFGGARPVDVRDEVVRQLGDREDVDEVEEQLEERRALFALRARADDRQLRNDRRGAVRRSSDVRRVRHSGGHGNRSGLHLVPFACVQ